MSWFPIKIVVVKPSDPRGWIGLGCYLLVVGLLVMMWADKSLLKDDFFKVIATAIILTGWNQGPVGWAYQATKGGGEAAESNARVAEAAMGKGPKGTAKDPISVAGASSGAKPVSVEEQGND